MEFNLGIKIMLIALPLSFFLSLINAAFFRLLKLKDPNLDKKRASHSKPTARLGGICAISAILITLLLVDAQFDFQLVFILMPVFLIGLLEDINLKTKTRTRLIYGCVSAALFIYFKEFSIKEANVIWLDTLLEIKSENGYSKINF